MSTLMRWNGTNWELAGQSNPVTLDTAQTITGQKTFNLAPIVPDDSFAISKVSGLQTNLDLKYSATNPPPAGTAPANMLTTDTAQTITAIKTFTPSSPGNMIVRSGARSGISTGSTFMFVMDNATTTDAGTSYQAIETASASIYGGINGTFGVWTAPSVTAGTNLTFTQKLGISGTTVNFYSSVISGTGSWTTTGSVTGANFKATGTGSSRWVGSTATGAPTSGTFLSNDWIIARDTGRIWQCTAGGTPGTWIEMTLPAGGSAPANMLTTDTVQTIVAAKTFSTAPLFVPGSTTDSAAHFGAEGSLTSITNGTFMGANLKYVGGAWKYISTSPASLWGALNGGVVFYSAPAGTVDGTATLTPTATLSSTGGFTANGGLFDGASNRVFSLVNPTQVMRNKVALQQFRSALGAARVTAADIIFLGDSITEGYYTTQDEERWTNIVTRALQKEYNAPATPGGEGYVAPHVGGMPGPQERWVMAGGVTFAGSGESDAGFGLGRRHMTIPAGGSATLTFYGTQVANYFTRGSGVGTATIVIDGGAPATFVTTGTPTQSSLQWVSGALTRGTHTMVVSVPTGQPAVVLEGAVVFDGDVMNGVRMHNGGHGGSTAGSLTTATTYWQEYLNRYVPDLVTIAFGHNEAKNGVAVATYEANLNAIIDKIRAVSASTANTSIIILAYPKRGDITDATWDSYLAAMKRVADGKSVAFFDMSQALAKGPSSGQTPLYYDVVHPTVEGHKAVAEFFLAELNMTLGRNAVYLNADQAIGGTKQFIKSVYLQAGATSDGGIGTSQTMWADSGFFENGQRVYSPNNPPPSKKYATTIGDGTTAAFTITHNLNDRDVIVQIYTASGTYTQQWATIDRTTLNTVTITFRPDAIPTTNQYRVVILGG